MVINKENPFHEEKKEILKRKDLSYAEKDELLDEVEVKNAEWIKNSLKELHGKIGENEEFIAKSKKEVVKLDKKDLRKVYKETVDKSRELKKLYNEMRELNKQVRDLLSK